jgi:hypothetical protein
MMVIAIKFCRRARIARASAFDFTKLRNELVVHGSARCSHARALFVGLAQ